MLIQELNINEFRGIKKTARPLKLSNLTVLIGRNNSGKSSILEAISLFPSPLQNEPLLGQSRINTLLSSHPTELKEYRKLIYRYEGFSKITYKIDILDEELSIEIRAKDIKLYRNNVILGATNFGIECLTLYIPNDTSIMQKLEKRMEELKKLIEKNKIHRSVVKSLNKCVDDEYSEIILLTPISIRKVFPDDSLLLELNDLGSGAEKVVKIMALIEVLNPDILLLDDFESGLHPSLIKMFLEWLVNKKWQTIIATHSIDVLYYLNELVNKNFVILQLNKSKNDILNYKELSLEEFKDLLDGNIDLRLL